MRIISQDGRSDIPYEKSILTLSNDCKVNVDAYINNRYVLLGKYSSIEKGARAMEMCRDKYSRKANVFQFPKDEEEKV